MASKRTQRFIFADALTALACVGVVLLHVSLDVYTPHQAQHWLHSAALQALAISSVPIFFMLSGFKLLDYRRRMSTKEFLTRRIAKVGCALLVGSIASYIVYGLFPGAFWDAEKLGIDFTPLNFVKLFLANGINDTYWFFYTIIGLYLLTPVLSRAVADEATERYTLMICVAVALLLPLARRVLADRASITGLFNWPLFSSEAVLYYVGGHYLARRARKLPRSPFVWTLVFICATAAMLLLAAWSTGSFSGALNESYDSYYISMATPLCAIAAAGLFLMFLNLETPLRALPTRALDAISYLARVSLVIYLVHTPITNWVSKGAPQAFGHFLNGHKLIEAAFVLAASLAIAAVWNALVKGASALSRTTKA